MDSRIDTGTPDDQPSSGPSDGTDPAELELPREDRERLVARDPEVLGRFYDLYFDRVYGFVRRLLHEEHLAEDITQDIFMHLHRAFQSYDPDRALRPWVFTIATNKVRDHWRSRRHQDGLYEVSAATEEGSDYELAPAEDSGRPEETLQASERSDTIEQAIDSLPDIMKTTLVLRYYEGLSFSEIGAMVDRNETAVRKRYSRALEELRRRLSGVVEPG